MSGKYQIFDVMSTEMEIHLRLSKPSDMLKKNKILACQNFDLYYFLQTNNVCAKC